MEGSVKNLIEAEREANEIVDEAREQMKKSLQSAKALATVEVNQKRKEWETKLNANATSVSPKMRVNFGAHSRWRG